MLQSRPQVLHSATPDCGGGGGGAARGCSVWPLHEHELSVRVLFLHSRIGRDDTVRSDYKSFSSPLAILVLCLWFGQAGFIPPFQAFPLVHCLALEVGLASILMLLLLLMLRPLLLLLLLLLM